MESASKNLYYRTESGLYVCSPDEAVMRPCGGFTRNGNYIGTAECDLCGLRVQYIRDVANGSTISERIVHPRELRTHFMSADSKTYLACAECGAYLVERKRHDGTCVPHCRVCRRGRTQKSAQKWMARPKRPGEVE